MDCSALIEPVALRPACTPVRSSSRICSSLQCRLPSANGTRDPGHIFLNAKGYNKQYGFPPEAKPGADRIKLG